MTRSERFLVWSTALAVPLALALETALRSALAPPEFVELRLVLHDLLTPVAWGIVGLALAASTGGLLLARRLYRRAEARLRPDADATERRRADVGVFLLVASVPQIPAIFATFVFSFGADLAPTLVSTCVSCAGVLAQARRLSERR